jgi:hypothetical protein
VELLNGSNKENAFSDISTPFVICMHFVNGLALGYKTGGMDCMQL